MCVFKIYADLLWIDRCLTAAAKEPYPPYRNLTVSSIAHAIFFRCHPIFIEIDRT